MPDQSRKFSTYAEGAAAEPVRSLASRVLDVVATRKATGSSVADDALVEILYLAAQESGPESSRDALQRLLAAGVPADAIVDRYIPEAARRLGTDWCENRLSFADVTIAASRLQLLLRMVAERFDGDNAPLDAPDILFVVPDFEHHTLAGLVAGHSLRRRGASVRFAIGESQDRVAAILSQRSYDGVMVSASRSGNLAPLTELVTCCHGAAASVPVIVGGTILAGTDDIEGKTGADCATVDLDEALRSCRPDAAGQGGRRPDHR